MKPYTPERLSRWMLMHNQPETLDLDHQAQQDIAWAADTIATLTEQIIYLREVVQKSNARHIYVPMTGDTVFCVCGLNSQHPIHLSTS